MLFFKLNERWKKGAVKVENGDEGRRRSGEWGWGCK